MPCLKGIKWRLFFPPQLKVFREGASGHSVSKQVPGSLPTWNYQGKNSPLTIKAGFFVAIFLNVFLIEYEGKADVAQW